MWCGKKPKPIGLDFPKWTKKTLLKTPDWSFGKDLLIFLFRLDNEYLGLSYAKNIPVIINLAAIKIRQFLKYAHLYSQIYCVLVTS